MRAILILAALGVSLGGCASITRGSTEIFQVTSEPTGAEATFSNGYSCTTPCSMEMKRRSEFVVTLRKEGYRTTEAAVTNVLSGGGGAALAGNIIIGGAIGVGVDAATGATQDLFPNPLNVVLDPVEPGTEDDDVKFIAVPERETPEEVSEES